MKANYYCSPAQKESDRTRIWTAARRIKSFTKRELVFESHTNWHACQEYVNALTKAGFLEKTSTKRNGSFVFNLVKDTGVEAPRLKRDGTLLDVPVNQKIWKAMGVYSRFTYTDLLMAVPETTRSTVKCYVVALVRAGYIKKMNKTEFYLIPSKVTGNLAPSLRRVKQVYDPNLEKVVWPQEELS